MAQRLIGALTRVNVPTFFRPTSTQVAARGRVFAPVYTGRVRATSTTANPAVSGARGDFLGCSADDLPPALLCAPRPFARGALRLAKTCSILRRTTSKIVFQQNRPEADLTRRGCRITATGWRPSCAH